MLDCISLDMKTGKYYYDMPKEELEQLTVEDGVLGSKFLLYHFGIKAVII